MDAVAYRASVVTMNPATMRVRLNASAEMSSVMPSAERFIVHQCGSLAVSMLATIPSTRNTASTVASSDRSMWVAEKKAM